MLPSIVCKLSFLLSIRLSLNVSINIPFELSVHFNLSIELQGGSASVTIGSGMTSNVKRYNRGE